MLMQMCYLYLHVLFASGEISERSAQSRELEISKQPWIDKQQLVGNASVLFVSE